MNAESTQLNSCVQIQEDDGVLTVWFGTPNRSVNVLNREMLDGIVAAIEYLESAPERFQAVVFRSRKPDCFFVGADVEAIAAIDNRQEALKVVRVGQKLMSRVEALPMPTIAAISGTCLGGGMELALACDFRIARDDPSTKMGLPEVKLGLLPGWGGTQRLPHIVGLRRALKMILTGKVISSSDGLREGLVHRIISTELWEKELKRTIGSELDAIRNSPKRQDWLTFLLDGNPIGRKIVLSSARKQIASKRMDYPALAEALQAISLSYSPERAYDEEREGFVRLLFSPTGRNLIGLFLARNKARKADTWLSSRKSSLPTIRNVAVIGAGAMGAGIGTLAASKGYEVVFKEIHDGAAQSGRERAEGVIQRQLEKKKITVDKADQTLDRMSFTADWADTADCDLAIEAVLEIETVKREVFEMLDRSLPAGSTLASNTSSLCVTRLATSTHRRQDVVGLHFFNPVDRMDLVEIVRTESTSEETLERALGFVHTLGKTPIVTSDKPGFLVNRILFPYLGEAIRMVCEGFDLHQMDREIRRFGMPMGPLELMDQIGIDIVHHVAQSQGEMQPESGIPLELLSRMVEQGWLGKKSKMGFYNYEASGEPKLNERLLRDAVAPATSHDYQDDGLSHIQRRLVYPILNEAVRCLDELVVSEAWMVDLGMVLGTGFAPHRAGPLHMIDQLGASVVVHNLSRMHNLYGERFRPADGLELRLRRNELFLENGPFPALTWEKQDEPQHPTHS